MSKIKSIMKWPSLIEKKPRKIYALTKEKSLAHEISPHVLTEKSPALLLTIFMYELKMSGL